MIHSKWHHDPLIFSPSYGNPHVSSREQKNCWQVTRLEICCSQNDATLLVQCCLAYPAVPLIVTRQCHGEAQEIMMEKMRFILYQLPTG